MDKKEALAALKKAKEEAKKRNFLQTVDLVINLKDIDLKKTDQQVDFYVTLHHKMGNSHKVCALVGPELADEAKKVCDHVINVQDFGSMTPREVKDLAAEYDFFVAQANVMPQVASNFGRILGPRGKMPNPKAGCVVPPKASLGPLYERLQKTIRVTAKDSPVLHLKVGREDQAEQEVVDNITFLYNQVVAHLPLEINNIKSSLLKLTMGKPVEL